MRKVLIILLAVLVFAVAYELSVSYALFESEKEFIVNSDIGKWNISVNGYSINETSTFSVNSVQVTSDSNVRTNYFAPGTSGFFEIEIDPEDTEVSIYYEIVCRDDMIANPQIHLTSIEDEDGNSLINVANFTYAGIIPLEDIIDGDTAIIKFYITWTNNENNNEIDSLYGSSSSEFDLPMSITFRQYLGESVTPMPAATATPVASPTATPEVTPDAG